jgi:hypothetical protein
VGMNICDQCMRGKLSVWKASDLNASVGSAPWLEAPVVRSPVA